VYIVEKNSILEQADRIERVIKPGLVALKTALIKEQITVNEALFPTFLYPRQPHSIKVRAIHRQALINFGAKTNNSVRYHSVQPSI
jgi:hypothetical protein